MTPVPHERVALLVPTLNAEVDLEKLLPALAAQTLAGRTELLAVDSSSTDRTVERLTAAGFRVESIARSDFGHGRTRNQLARMATADFLIFLSQDATPIDASFLEEMLAPFSDPTVGGVIARVLPNPGDDPLTARTVLGSPEASDVPRTRRWSDPESYGAMSGAERADLLRFNNVASCVRRELLEEIPFPEVPFGEDFAWARQAMAAGWAIHFEPKAAVFHAHRYGPMAALRRYRTDAVFHRQFHGNRIRPSLFSVVKGTLHEIREDARYLARLGPDKKGRLSAALVSPVLRCFQTFGQYLGSSGRGGAASEVAAWEAARARGEIDSVCPSESSLAS
ncbi:MAG: rhamnosyltransferase [Planctomycetota bacterium]|jgi:GT2 family glycosyltransferase